MNFDEWREIYSTGPLMNEAMARAAWDAAIAAERDRVCKIVYGKCISDNNAFEIVQAIKAVTEKGASNHDAERNDSTG